MECFGKRSDGIGGKSLSYSQYGEEEHILECVKGCTSKRLIDIGAWDPICFSNSRALIEAGWSAVLIEPSPGPLKNLIREYGGYKDVRVISAAVTVEGGLLDLEITDDAVSMPAGDRIEEWRSTVNFYGRLTVPAISVSDLFKNYTEPGVEFVNIDTEGSSVPVFAAMCKVGVRPRCVCVEHDSRFVELSQYAEAADYRLVHENGTNRVYQWTGVRE